MERRIEEDHGTAAEGTVRTAGLQKQGRGHGQTAQLNLASCLLDEVVAVLFRAALHLDQVRMLSVAVAAEPVTHNRASPVHPPISRRNCYRDSPTLDLPRTPLRAWQPPRPPHSTPGVTCLLYTSDAADDLLCVDLGGRRII